MATILEALDVYGRPCRIAREDCRMDRLIPLRTSGGRKWSHVPRNLRPADLRECPFIHPENVDRVFLTSPKGGE